MNVNDPASSPSGAHFIPQLPPLGTEPIRPFLDSLELEFELNIRDGPNRKVLLPRRRAEMKDILRNPSIQYSKEVYPDSKERARLRSLKDWTLKHFLLDDNQIYRKAETVRGIEYNQRYAACTYDSFDLITRTHRGLHHAGKSNITYYMILCLVRFYTNNFYTNQELIKLMNEFLSYIMELLKKSHGYFQNAKSVQQIKPIGSRQVLLRLLVNDA
jgi:hypothetical protein